MASGSAIRGSRVGAGPMGEAERGESAPRLLVSYWCANGHETRPSFSEEAGLDAEAALRDAVRGLEAAARQMEPPPV